MLGEIESLPPLPLGTTERVMKLSAGYQFTCAIFESGKIKCWGHNNGQAGIGLSPEKVGASNSHLGGNLPFIDLGTGVIATDISCGEEFCCALLESGYAKCWGDNTDGKLGLVLLNRAMFRWVMIYQL